jgi:hypothetical protein
MKLNGKKPKMRRVIDQLRKQFPGKWVWEGPDAPYRWHSETMTVTCYSKFVPSCPNDDNTFCSEYMDQDGNVIFLDQSYRTYHC